MRKNILIFMLALLIISMNSSISIGKESLSKDAKTDIKATEKSFEKIVEKKKENEKQDLSEESKEGSEEKEVIEEGKEGKGEEEEEKPAWKFTGWQAIFALIAVGYYILVLKFLPFIVEKKNAGGHH